MDKLIEKLKIQIGSLVVDLMAAQTKIEILEAKIAELETEASKDNKKE